MTVEMKREWTTRSGIRCAETLDGEVCIAGGSLAAWLLSIHPSDSGSPIGRAALERFHREAPLLTPAGQYRLAIQTLNELGAQIPPEFHQLRPRLVKNE
jgi:hypothetical protein